MTPTVRSSLVDARRDAIEKAAAAMLSGDWRDGARQVRRAQRISSLVKAIDERRPRDKRLAWAVLLLVTATTLLLWAIRMPSPSILVSATGSSTTLRFDVAHDLAADIDLASTGTRANGLSAVSLSGSDPNGPNERDLKANSLSDVVADGLSLMRLRGAAGTSIRIEPGRKSCYTLHLLRGSITAEIGSLKGLSVRGKFSEGSSLSGSALRLDAVYGHSASDLTICPLAPIDLNLGELAAVGMGQPTSGLEHAIDSWVPQMQGKLSFAAVDHSYLLENLQSIRISGVAPGAVAALRLSDGQAHLRLAGQAQEVAANAAGTYRDLRPSILSYLMAEKGFALAFAGFSFFWGIAWSLHKLFAA